MEITQIAQQTVDALKPALPFLTAGGGMVAVGAAWVTSWRELAS